MPGCGGDGDGEARYIYLTRNGRDACVSFFHHLSHMAVEDGGYTGTFDQFVLDFTSGALPYGSWSAHIKAWMGCRATDDPRVLFLSYEDLKVDLRGAVTKVSTHLGLPHSAERIDQLLPKFSFQWMRANEAQFNPKSVRWTECSAAQVLPTLDESAAGGAAADASGAVGGDGFHFIRRGAVGEGKARFTPEQDELFNAMVRRTFPQHLPDYLSKILR